MKQKNLRVIPVLLIIGIMILAGCSVPQQLEKKDVIDKQTKGVPEQQASIESLQYALGTNTYVVAIAGGAQHSLAIDSLGRLWATGDNTRGQLGLGSISQVNEWTLVPDMNNVTAISCGFFHSLILRDRLAQGGTYGEVWATGYNDSGQLGFGDNNNRNVFEYTHACYASAIAAGGYHSLLISGGTVWATGRNAQGQLGFNNGTNLNGFNMVPNLYGVTAIAAGGFHSLYLKGGKVWATGYNWEGELGMGSVAVKNYYNWTEVPDMNNVSAIACGDSHSIILRDRTGQGGTYGEVWGAGDNTYGQAGLWDNSRGVCHNSFENTGACFCSAIAAGGHNSLVLSSGTVWASGIDWYGLGRGNLFGFYYTGTYNCSAIAVGGDHSLALSNGSVLATGKDTKGQLGLGNKKKDPGFTQ
jgi:alpha-tubulin suppressor-like RCC1 family protein